MRRAKWFLGITCVLALFVALLTMTTAFADDVVTDADGQAVVDEAIVEDEAAPESEAIVEDEAVLDEGLVSEETATEAVALEEPTVEDDDIALSEQAVPNCTLYWHCHVQGKGDLPVGGGDDSGLADPPNGITIGTTGEGRRLESFGLYLYNYPDEDPVVLEYCAHIQGLGWQGWKDYGDDAGTHGQSRRIEAIRIRFKEECNYDVLYRVHVQGIGWMGWASNGSVAGTTGMSRRIEAIQVCVIYQDTTPTLAKSDVPYPSLVRPSIEYRAHVQGIGWQGWVKDGALAGTSGQSRRVEALNIRLAPAVQYHVTGGIEYRAHVQGIGWQGWVHDGALAGTSGQSRRVEALCIRLTGDYGKQFDVYYRVHVQGIGWMGWAKNGQEAGTSGMSRRIEGIQIRIVPRGAAAPGSTANHYQKK